MSWRLAIVAVIGCGPAAPRATTPASGDVELVILDRGAEPRQLLRYPTEPLTRTVSLTWSGARHDRDSHSKRDESITYVERTLRGTWVGATSGRAAVDLLTGTSAPAPTGVVLDGMRSETASLATELPAHFALRIDPQRLEPDPIHADARSYMDLAYGESIFVALPRRLPADPVGRGARWQVVARLGDDTRTVTWELTAIDGGTVTLTGTQASHPVRGSTAIRSAIDFTTFSVDATVERSSHGSQSNALTAQTSDDSAVATLSIQPSP